jgi:hypothetical protein
MRRVFDNPDKLFMTEFMVVAVLSSNVSLTEDEVCRIIHRTLQEPRAAHRIKKAISNLLSRNVVCITEFGNVCLVEAHRNILRA